MRIKIERVFDLLKHIFQRGKSHNIPIWFSTNEHKRTYGESFLSSLNIILIYLHKVWKQSLDLEN